ncbi:MAG: Bacterioferritin, partial [Acetothermia bacterium 64_32]
MKGNERLLEELNRRLREELSAINQYFVHAEECEDWGYVRLAKAIKARAITEMRHAEALIERILFLEGKP